MLIKNGFLIDPATKKSGNYDIRIKNGIITEIGNTLSPAPNEQVTDAAGLTVAPGLIDTHIHFRDPGFTYKENIHTGSQAAAAGGFTSVICMANTSPVVDNTGSVENCRSMRIYRRWHSVEKRRVFIRGNGKIQTAKRTDQPS